MYTSYIEHKSLLYITNKIELLTWMSQLNYTVKIDFGWLSPKAHSIQLNIVKYVFMNNKMKLQSQKKKYIALIK